MKAGAAILLVVAGICLVYWFLMNRQAARPTGVAAIVDKAKNVGSGLVKEAGGAESHVSSFLSSGGTGVWDALKQRLG